MNENNDTRVALIKHFSSEISEISKSMTTFRGRVNFTTFFGPFIILGTYLYVTHGRISLDKIDNISKGTFMLLGICWISLGAFSGLVEKSAWDKCTKWRNYIVKLQSTDKVDFLPDDLKLFKRVFWIYAVVYTIQFIIFVLMISILNIISIPN